MKAIGTQTYKTELGSSTTAVSINVGDSADAVMITSIDVQSNITSAPTIVDIRDADNAIIASMVCPNNGTVNKFTGQIMSYAPPFTAKHRTTTASQITILNITVENFGTTSE